MLVEVLKQRIRLGTDLQDRKVLRRKDLGIGSHVGNKKLLNIPVNIVLSIKVICCQITFAERRTEYLITGILFAVYVVEKMVIITTFAINY